MKWWSVFILVVSVVLAISSCTGTQSPVTGPEANPNQVPELLNDTISPSQITGLVGINAFDGKVNLWWNKSTADDFDHYNIYVGQIEITDVTDLAPIHQIRDISVTNYQAAGLKDGVNYYFAVTASDKSNNEDKQAAFVSAIPTPMSRGTVEPDFYVNAYQSDKVWAGTTLLPDNYNPQKPRIVEINMLGEIVWEYLIPENVKQYTNPGFDVELLQNDNILFVLPRKGVYEIDRGGKVVWSYITDKSLMMRTDCLMVIPFLSLELLIKRAMPR